MSVQSRARRALASVVVVAVAALVCPVAPASAEEEKGRLRIQVVDTSGQPEPGVYVYVLEPAGEHVTRWKQSDEQGRVTFDVAAGRQRWQVVNPSYPGTYLEHRSPLVPDVPAGVTTVVEHRVTRAAFAKGRVLTSDGRAQGDVQMGFTPQGAGGVTAFSSVTTPNGRWTGPASAPGSYRISAHLGDEVSRYQRPPQAVQVDLVEGGTTQVPDVRLEPAAAATGRVVDGDGDPVSGAQVSIVEPLSSSPWERLVGYVTTADDGRFDLAHLEPGRWRVQVRHPASGTSYDDRDGTDLVAGVDTALGDIALRSKPVALVKPSITGEARVGSTLSVTPGEWSEDVELSYQWMVEDDVFVASRESTYVPTPETVGRRITVLVGAVPEFGPATSVETDPTAPVQAVPTGTVRSIDPPVITGTPRLGSTLTVSSGTWSPSGLSFRYQWFMDGAAIDGATKATYTPTPGAVGRILMVRVTAGKPGFAEASRLSNTTGAVVGPVEVVRPPSLVASEQPVVGETVTVDRGYWRPSRLTWSYVWVRDGAAIPSSTPGARSSSYTLTSADWGRNVAVRVSGERSGFGVQRRYTESVYVKRRPSMSNTTEVLGGGSVRLTAKVVVVGATNPVGAVKVLEDGEEVATMPAMVKGVSSLTLTGRTPGAHTYTLAYEGNRLVVPAERERTVTVR